MTSFDGRMTCQGCSEHNMFCKRARAATVVSSSGVNDLLARPEFMLSSGP